MSNADQRVIRLREMLRRLAATLDKPEHAFFTEGEPTSESTETVELLRVWDGLRNETDRRKILAFARGIAGRPDDQDEMAAAAG